MATEARHPAAASEALQAVKEEPVVVVSSSTCPFCSQIKGFLMKHDINAVLFETDELGDVGKTIRRELTEQTGQRTVPYLFVKGQLIGGFSEVVDAWEKGSLQADLEEGGISFR